MFHLPPYARHQYLAAQAEAKAAEAAAKAMEAEYLASEALRQEEESLKARLYEIEQRKKYSRSSGLPTAVGYPRSFAAPVAPTFGVDFPFVPEHIGYGGFEPSAAYHPGYELKAKLREERDARRAAEQELKRKEKEIAALRSRSVEVPQPPFYAVRQPAHIPQRGPEQLRHCHFQDVHIHRERFHPRPPVHPHHGPSPSSPSNDYSGQDLLSALFKNIVPDQHTHHSAASATLPQRLGRPTVDNSVKGQQAAPSVPRPGPTEEAFSNLFQSMLFGQDGSKSAHCHKHAHSAPKATVPPAQPSSSKTPAFPANVVEQLKARYEVDNDDEMRDTLKAIIESLRPEPSQEQPEVSGGTNKSLIEQLQSRYHKEDDQELRDTIQATINSLADGFVHFSSPSPPAASTTSSSKGKAKDTSTPSSPTSTASLQRVDKVASEFRALEAEFTFPPQLDFVPSSTESATAISRLAFTARNHPVRFYEQSLTTLLSDLDLIESHGDLTLRNKRKEVVTLIEEALDLLEREIIGRWNSKMAKDAESAQSSPKVPTEELKPVPTESGDLSESTVTVRGTDLMSESPEHLVSSSLSEEEAADATATTTTTVNDISNIAVNEVTSTEVEEEDPNDHTTASVSLSSVPEGEVDETTPFIGSEPESDSVQPSSVETAVPQDAEDVDENSFLLAQPTQLSPESPKKVHKVEIEDLGSDWSDVDA